MRLQKSSALKGEITVPGDKSISHRGVMLGAIAKGTTKIHGFLKGGDCLSTISCFRKLGVEIFVEEEQVIVHGKGLHGLSAPEEILDCGNSGTTMRLLSGILSAQPFSSTLTGDASIRKRPMNRIITPLSQMGARIQGNGEKGCAPLHITGSSLWGIHYASPVASAQVKSSILLAGLYAKGQTTVTEPSRSRDHSERMLRAFGAKVDVSGTSVTVTPPEELYGQDVWVPGDISSAAYFIAAALIVPGSNVLIKNVGINPTRDGMLKVCRQMGGEISIVNQREESGEPCADLLVSYSHLKGTVIEGDLIPTLIDELPILAVLAAFAEGTTVIRDAAELKVKESNRIASVAEGLLAMGAVVTETEDGMIIQGGTPLKGASIQTFDDHRIAMSFSIAALAAEGETEIVGADCVTISYPSFYQDLERLQ